MPSLSLFSLTVIASMAITAQRFTTITGEIATAGGYAFGVARSDAQVGDAIAVDNLGTATVDAGGTFAVGDEVEVGAGGKAVLRDTGKVVGRALSAGVDGKPAEIYLIQN